MSRGPNRSKVLMRQDMKTDTYEALYPCGHTIGIPAAAISRHGARNSIPSQCPTCAQQQLGLKWVHQEEAKLWNADPSWGGFPPAGQSHMAASASHSAGITSQFRKIMFPEVETGPLAWLDYQVERVCRAATM